MKLFKRKPKQKNFGEFILELRKEKHLSQYDLAELVPISREAVSKWERNTTKPNKASLTRLSEIFEISSEELLLGRRVSEEERKELTNLTLDLYEQRNKKQKLLKISLIIIILLVFIFLIYYFLTSYNSIKVYKFIYDKDNIVIENGIFVTTREKLYFNIGNIDSDKEIKNLRLYYKKDNKEINLNSSDTNYIFLYDYYGYDKYFEYKDLKKVLNNMYLEITYEDDIKTIKIEFKKDFANILISKNKNEIVDESTLKVDSFKINEDLIKQKFTFENGLYTYNLDNDSITFNYIESIKYLTLTVTNKDIIETWDYNLPYNELIYKKFENKKELKSYSYSENENNCQSEDCVKTMQYFYDIMSKVLTN